MYTYADTAESASHNTTQTFESTSSRKFGQRLVVADVGQHAQTLVAERLLIFDRGFVHRVQQLRQVPALPLGDLKNEHSID